MHDMFLIIMLVTLTIQTSINNSSFFCVHISKYILSCESLLHNVSFADIRRAAPALSCIAAAQRNTEYSESDR